MALIIVLICLGLQRYLKLHQYAYKLHWLNFYFKWMMTHSKQIARVNGVAQLAILILPILIATTMIFVMTSFILNDIGYFLLSSLLLWFSIDARDLRKAPYTLDASAISELFVITYQRLFSMIFWFVICNLLDIGPVFIVYITIVSLQLYLTEQIADEKYAHLLNYTIKLRGILDWVPMQLLSLSYALAGQFSEVFKLWCRYLSNKGGRWDQQQVAELGVAAMGTIDINNTYNESVALIDRTLVVWLIMLALFTVGIWLG